jgi:hypothetical protein
LKPITLCAFAAALFAAAIVHADDVTVYSNFTTYGNNGVLNEGASEIGGDDITSLVADDITPISGYSGDSVDALEFTVLNNNSSSVTFRPLVRIYDSDGASGGPGTFIAGFDLHTITLSAGQNQGFIFQPGTPLFTLPSGTFWAGLIFDDDNGTTGITSTQLNGMGQDLFNPPTVGTSADHFFASNDAGSFESDNPDGQLFRFTNDTFVSNFGWGFAVSTPEPAGTALLLAGAGLLFTRRTVWRLALK